MRNKKRTMFDDYNYIFGSNVKLNKYDEFVVQGANFACAYTPNFLIEGVEDSLKYISDYLNDLDDYYEKVEKYEKILSNDGCLVAFRGYWVDKDDSYFFYECCVVPVCKTEQYKRLWVTD